MEPAPMFNAESFVKSLNAALEATGETAAAAVMVSTKHKDAPTAKDVAEIAKRGNAALADLTTQLKELETVPTDDGSIGRRFDAIEKELAALTEMRKRFEAQERKTAAYGGH